MVLLIQMLEYTSPLMSFRAVSSQSKFPNVILGCTKLPMQRAQPVQLINPQYPSDRNCALIEEMNVLIWAHSYRNYLQNEKHIILDSKIMAN